MLYQHPWLIRVSAFFAASLIAFVVQGTVLSGFQGLATQADEALAAGNCVRHVAAQHESHRATL